MPKVTPWLSTSDIGTGERWTAALATALRSSRVGILCITPENQTAPWVLFEAGALSRDAEAAVCPYLIGFAPSQMTAEPLTLFQATTASKQGTFDLLRAINRSVPDEALSDEALDFAFRRHWPALDIRLRNAERRPEKTAVGSRDAVLSDLLVSVQDLLHQLTASGPSLSAQTDEYCEDPSNALGSTADSPTAAELEALAYCNMSAEQLAQAIESSGLDPRPTSPSAQMAVDNDQGDLGGGGARSSAFRGGRGPSAWVSFGGWAVAA